MLGPTCPSTDVPHLRVDAQAYKYLLGNALDTFWLCVTLVAIWGTVLVLMGRFCFGSAQEFIVIANHPYQRAVIMSGPSSLRNLWLTQTLAA